MAAVTVPSARSLLGKASAAVAARRRARGAAGRVAVFAAKAREHVVTTAALVSADVGAFHICQAAGWIVTGVSLLALDFAVRG